MTQRGFSHFLPLDITHLGSRKATEQNRQNKQRQESCGDKAANNHAGQWLLISAPTPVDNSIGIKPSAEVIAVIKTGRKRETAPSNTAAILYSLIDAFDHNDPVKHRHTKQCDKSNGTGHGKILTGDPE